MSWRHHVLTCDRLLADVVVDGLDYSEHVVWCAGNIISEGDTAFRGPTLPKFLPTRKVPKSENNKPHENVIVLLIIVMMPTLPALVAPEFAIMPSVIICMQSGGDSIIRWS